MADDDVKAATAEQPKAADVAQPAPVAQAATAPAAAGPYLTTRFSDAFGQMGRFLDVPGDIDAQAAAKGVASGDLVVPTADQLKLRVMDPR